MTPDSNPALARPLTDDELSALWAQAYLSCPEDQEPAVWFGRHLQVLAAERQRAHSVARLERYQFVEDISVWLHATKKDLVQMALRGAVAEIQGAAVPPKTAAT